MEKSDLWCLNQHICKDNADDIVCTANKLGNLAMRCPFVLSDEPVNDCPKYIPTIESLKKND